MDIQLKFEIYFYFVVDTTQNINHTHFIISFYSSLDKFLDENVLLFI